MSTYAFPLSFQGAEVLPTCPHLPLLHEAPCAPSPTPGASQLHGLAHRSLGDGRGRPWEVRQRKPGLNREEHWSSGTCQGPRSLVPCTAAAQLWCSSPSPTRGPKWTAVTLLCAPPTHRPSSPSSSSHTPASPSAVPQARLPPADTADSGHPLTLHPLLGQTRIRFLTYWVPLLPS